MTRARLFSIFLALFAAVCFVWSYEDIGVPTIDWFAADSVAVANDTAIAPLPADVLSGENEVTNAPDTVDRFADSVVVADDTAIVPLPADVFTGENEVTNAPDTVSRFTDSVAVANDTAIVPLPDDVVSGENEITDALDTIPAPADITPVPRRSRRSELGQMSREELFRIAFGHDAPARQRNLRMHLIVEGRRLGEVDIVYSEDYSSFDFISPRLASRLNELMLPEVRPLAGDDNTHLFNSATLKAAGYTVYANEMRFELHIIVPPEGKALQRMNLASGQPERELRGEELDPAYVSFYINYRLTDRFRYTIRERFPPNREPSRTETALRDIREPARLDIDGALMSFGWVLESSAFIYEPQEWEEFTMPENFARGDIRLMRDIVSLQSKLTIGDIYLGSEILSYGGTVGGVHYEYNRWFFGNTPHGGGENSVTFFLPRVGTVELFINGRYVNRFPLPAGHHEITGFSGDIGRNNVRLVLRTDGGVEDEIEFDFIQSTPRNLPKGEKRYTMATGFRRNLAPMSPFTYSYDMEETAMSASLMYGLYNAVSVGVAGLASPYNGLAGAEILLDMGSFGNVSLRGALNYAGFRELGSRADVSYTSNFAPAIVWLNRRLPGENLLPRVTFALRGHFETSIYGTDLFDAEYRIDGLHQAGVSGNIGSGFFRGGISASAGAIFEGAGRNPGDYPVVEYNYGGSISQTVYNIPINVNFGISVRGEERNPYFSISSNYAFGSNIGIGTGMRHGRHNFTAGTAIGLNTGYRYSLRYDDDDPDFEDSTLDEDIIIDIDWGWRASAGWLWSTGHNGVGGRHHSASLIVPDVLDVINSPIPQLSTTMRHTYNRAILTSNYSRSNLTSPILNVHTHTVNAMLAGSFMFADGLWAFGRPVDNGFILIDGRRGLGGANIHVDRTLHLRRDISKSGLLGAAYKNSLNDYSITPLRITLTDAPLGIILLNNQYYTQGSAKQGYALRLGDKSANVLLFVRFMNEDRPISHIYTVVEPETVTRDDAGYQATFTGSDGVLQAGGLIPGRTYRIRFGESAGIKDVFIDIPKDAGFILELPDIQVERR